MKNLLVPIDFSGVSGRVVCVAEELARALGGKVWLLHCVTEYRTGDDFSPESTTDEALPERFPHEHRRLMDVAAALAHKGIEVEPIFECGVPVEVILAAAEMHGIDLIIVGSHGHGVLYELLVGTVAKSVLLRAGRPTLIIPSCGETKVSSRGATDKQEAGALEFTCPEFFGMST